MSGGLSVYTGQPSFSVLRGRSGFSQTSENHLVGRIKQCLVPPPEKVTVPTGNRGLEPAPWTGHSLSCPGLIAGLSVLSQKEAATFWTIPGPRFLPASPIYSRNWSGESVDG